MGQAALSLCYWWEKPAANDECASGKLFPGQYYDVESGLHYNYFRTYDPELGRYITYDPIGLLGGINTYGYVEGNPVGSIDPLGLWSLSLDYYNGAGGGITIGQNPDGRSFVSLRFGYGKGGGIVLDPDGTSPNYDFGNCGQYGGTSVGVFGNAGFTAGSPTYSYGFAYGGNPTYGSYDNLGPSDGIDFNFGFNAGVAVGVEITTIGSR